MTTFSIIAALAAASLPAPSAALGEVEIIRVTIEHRDLDLADPRDQRRLERRVGAAINDACPRNRLDLRSASHANECRKLARTRADGQVRFAIARANAAKTRLAATDGNSAG